MAAKHGGLKACVLDARDRRRTYIPGPSIDEFRSIVAKLEEELPSFKLPRQYYHFFQQTGIEGISKQDLASDDRYETPSASSSSVRTKAIKNDYTVYNPLNAAKKEIRLAYLAPGSPNDPLLVDVHTVPYPWIDPHKFWVALSYTWGSMDETRQILLGHSHCRGNNDAGEEEGGNIPYAWFSCTASLEIALRGLRRKEDAVFLWIDALCINQGDLEERTRQVAMMAEIYNHAPLVAIWLGSDPETVQAAAHIKMLPVVLQMMREKKDRSNALKSGHHVVEHMVRDFDPGGSPLSRSKLAPRILKLLSNPWFSRAWVVQEVWAARSIIVTCGEGRHISWEAVMHANSYAMAYAKTRPCDGSAASPVKKPPGGQYRTVESRGWSVWGRLVRDPGDTDRSEPIPVLELLELVTFSLDAGDKRDLIFAILGMSTEASSAMHHPPLITPDYRKVVWQVDSDFTRWHINLSQSLNIFGYVTYMDRGDDAKLDGSFPSWSISPSLTIPWIASGTISNRTPFHADADTLLGTTLIGSVPGDRSLVTRGYEVDSIAWADDHFFSPVFNLQNREGLADFAPFPWRVTLKFDLNSNSCGLEWLWRMVRAKRSVGNCDAHDQDDDENGDEMPPCKCQQTFDEMLDAVTCGRWMRMRLRDGIGQIPLADIRYEQYDMSKIYSCFASHWIARTTDPEMKQFCQRLRKLLLPRAEKSKQNQFADGVMEASYKKSLFVTRGGAMGVCPPQARKGDAVVLLFGCRMPVILRRRQDAVSNQDSTDWSQPGEDSPWEFIGESYVNGFMDGEMMKGKRESSAPVQTFTLW